MASEQQRPTKFRLAASIKNKYMLVTLPGKGSID